MRIGSEPMNVADFLVSAERLARGRVVDLDAELAVRKAQPGVERRLRVADCIIVSTAERHGAEIWTQEASFRGLPNVRYFPKIAPPAPGDSP